MVHGAVIKVSIDVFRGVIVYAKGPPAKAIAVAGVAAIAAGAAAVGYLAYCGGKALLEKNRKRISGENGVPLVPAPVGHLPVG